VKIGVILNESHGLPAIRWPFGSSFRLSGSVIGSRVANQGVIVNQKDLHHQ
jgi:hypothetical protein